MKSGYLPEQLYEALPFIYLGSGLLTMIMLPNFAGFLSGAMLISAGATVWRLRYRYRRAFNCTEGHIDYAENTGGSLVQILWKKAFECGHSVIDAQHRRLFGLGNELISAVSTNRPPGDIEWLLDELIEHITDHFCTEEAALARTRHPISAEHREIHRQLLAKAADLRDRLHSGLTVTSEIVGFIVYDVITNHITQEDLKFAVATE